MEQKEATTREIDEEALKRVEYYSASVTAWFNTSLEHDKSLLTLSSGGIGFLLALLTTVGLSSGYERVLCVIAIASLGITIVIILLIFRQNRKHIEDILSAKPGSNELTLSRLDTTAQWAFGIGVICTALIGIATAINSHSDKEQTMSNETANTTRGCAMDSVNGMAKLQPTVMQKSFIGAANLQPQPAASSTASAAPVTQTTSSPTNQTNANSR